MSEPRALVEHFFRHEFGRPVAVLTRSLAVRRLDRVEDVVQAALVQALETWSRRGVPEDPAGLALPHRPQPRVANRLVSAVFAPITSSGRQQTQSITGPAPTLQAAYDRRLLLAVREKF